MPFFQSYFNDDWLDFEKFPNHAEWLQKVDKTNFQCTVCKTPANKPKIVKMSNMGYRAITSHFNYV